MYRLLDVRYTYLRYIKRKALLFFYINLKQIEKCLASSSFTGSSKAVQVEISQNLNGKNVINHWVCDCRLRLSEIKPLQFSWAIPRAIQDPSADDVSSDVFVIYPAEHFPNPQALKSTDPRILSSSKTSIGEF